MNVRRLPVYCLTIALLALACAHQGSPGGGPDDKIGPHVVSSAPEPGACRVDVRSRVTITFSEWISRAAAPKSISILPPVAGGAKIRVSGRKLELVPAHGFADSTTYHIVITASLLDLRNNPLAAPYTLVFSTGRALDSGRVAGCVADAAKQTGRPIVALFRAAAEESDSLLFGQPDYLTQTDSVGFFSFENIHPGAYHIVAFFDQNNDRRLAPKTEAAFTTTARTADIRPAGDTVMLFPVRSDTATPRLLSARPLSSTCILCTFSCPFDSAGGPRMPSFAVERIDGKGKNPSVARDLWIGDRKAAALMLGDTLSLAPYRIIATLNKMRGSTGVQERDSMRMNGTLLRDTVRPALASVSPAGTVALRPVIKLAFTKPVTITGPLALTDTLRDTVKLEISPGYSDTVTLTPVRRLHAGSRYRLLLRCGAGADLSGNRLKSADTTDTAGSPRFPVIQGDSLAVILAGCAPCLTASKNRKWRFIPLGGGNESVCPDSAGCFRFDSLPSGRGFVGCFSDVNGNGRQDPGSLTPWSAPEEGFVFSDTVEARARWEVEGVTVKACDLCKPQKTAPAAK